MRVTLNTRIGGDFLIALATLVAVLSLTLVALESTEREAHDVRAHLGPAIEVTSTLIMALEQMDRAEDRYFLTETDPARWQSSFDRQAAVFENHLVEIDEVLQSASSREVINRINQDFSTFLTTDGQIRALLSRGHLEEAERLNLTTSAESSTRIRESLRKLRNSKLKELETKQASLEASMTRTRWRLFWISLCGMLVGIVYWWRSARLIVAPLAALQEASRAVAGGNFRQVRHPAAGSTTEIHALQEDFNTMASRLAETTAALEDARSSLEDQVGERTAELEKARRNLERMVEELKAVDKMKSDLMGVMSHELLTPINFILAYGSTLEDQALGDLNVAQRRAVDVILEGAGRLTRMVRNVLDFTQIESGQATILPQAIDYRSILEEAAESFDSAATARGIRISVDLADDLPAVLADPGRTWQVVRELLDNAVKFSRDHGQVRVSARRTGDVVETAIADEGPGLGTSEVQNLFKPFYQADLTSTRMHGGLGLGLTIAQRLVAAMGGSLLVESAQGKGTVIRFTLPVAPDPANRSQLDARAAENET